MNDECYQGGQKTREEEKDENDDDKRELVFKGDGAGVTHR